MKAPSMKTNENIISLDMYIFYNNTKTKKPVGTLVVLRYKNKQSKTSTANKKK